MLNRKTELRKLTTTSLRNIANFISEEDWKKIVPLIPMGPHNRERRYSSKQINEMEDYAKESNHTLIEVLVNEWGTTGRVRPTLDTLMKLLQEVRAWTAFEEIARMIGEPLLPRSHHTQSNDGLHNGSHDNISTKPAAEKNNLNSLQVMDLEVHNSIPNVNHRVSPKEVENDTSNSFHGVLNRPNFTDIMRNCDNMMTSKSTNSDVAVTTNTDEVEDAATSQNQSLTKLIYSLLDLTILDNKKLVSFDYKVLAEITGNFSEIFTPEGPTGRIGSGGFGDVYVGVHKTWGAVAIKRVQIDGQKISKLQTAMKIFNTEVKSLTDLQHRNIVPIYGYSIDGPIPCLVCKYIEGGTLRQKIAARRSDCRLTEQERIDIMIGIATGLHYIHHSERPKESDEVVHQMADHLKKRYYLHGDVTTANILLTKENVPMLCDFGLVKQIEATRVTSTAMGTQPYMSLEGSKGTLTQKNDVYSYGIVLMEMLTGLPPRFRTPDGFINIKEYIAEQIQCSNGDITPLLDSTVLNWTKAQKLYDLTKNCIADKDDRLSIDDVCRTLNEINISHS